jgi:lysophospholipid acyltransferase (LPLAT)-like uncharacterized protein
MKASRRLNLSRFKAFDVLKYKVVMPWLSHQLIPGFLNGVRRVWHRADWHVHPETQALMDSGTPVIFTLWHGQMFTLMHPAWMRMTPPPYVLISQSRDGDFITQIAHHIGFSHTIRGAHGRGGTEAALFIRRLFQEKKGHVICLLDGPKGPRHKAKAGIVLLAQQLQVPIIPLAGVTARHWFKLTSAWDAFEIPDLFTRPLMRLGCPVYLPTDLGRHEALQKVSNAMQAHFYETQALRPDNPKNEHLS